MPPVHADKGDRTASHVLKGVSCASLEECGELPTGLINATLLLGSFTLSGLANIIVSINSTAAVKLAAADPSKMPDAIGHFTNQPLQDAVMAQYFRAGDAGGPFYNNWPWAQSDSYTVQTDHDLIVDKANGVLTNDLDSDGDALAALPGSTPLHGTVTINADSSFRYSPNAGYAGPDSFYYYASDGVAQSGGQVSIYVDGPHPIVTDVAVSPSSGILYLHDNITIAVTMSSAVTIDQTNAQLYLFTNYGWASYQAGADPYKLVFTLSIEDYTPTGVPLEITGKRQR